MTFLPLYVTNFFGVVNDNFLKTLACFSVLSWVADVRLQAVCTGLTAGALVLPFILFSPLADRLTAIYPKRRILLTAKVAEIFIVLLGILGLYLHSLSLVIVGVTLMGLQSALYSPAKYSLLRDIGGVSRISTGMGGMEAVSFLGMLAGTIAAGLAAEKATPFCNCVALVAFAVAGVAGALTIRAKETVSGERRPIGPFRYFCEAAAIARKTAHVQPVILALSVFWFAAAMLQMGLLVYGPRVLGLGPASTGALLCAAAVGIVLGQFIAGFVDRRHFLLGAVPLTGGIAAVLLLALFALPANATAAAVIIALLAFDLGFFKLPLDTEIQKVAKGSQLTTMLAYFNQVSFLFMLAASGVYALVGWLMGPRAFLAVLGVVLALTTLVFVLTYRPALVFVGRWIFRRRYDIRTSGFEKLSSEKTCLVLPNHPAMVDPMLTIAELYRTPVRPLADEAFFHSGLLAPTVLKTLGAVEVPDLRKHRTAAGAVAARGLAGVVLAALSRGESVFFYPSGHIQTEANVESIGTRQLAYNVCRELPSGIEVVLIRTCGLWGSIWSRRGRTASPDFAVTFLKSVLLWLFVSPFRRRRVVTMHAEVMTEEVRDWSALTRVEFNRRLEIWYNEDSEKSLSENPLSQP